MSIDVTDEQQARATVEAELELFRGIADAGPVPVARTDALGAVVYASPRWESLLDDPDTRLAGLGWLDLLVPEHGEQLGSLARESVRSRQPFGMRVRVRDTLALDESTVAASGRFWGDLRAAPVFGPDGRLDGFVVVVADISGQVAADELAQRLAQVLKVGTDYVVIERGGALSLREPGRARRSWVSSSRRGEARDRSSWTSSSPTPTTTSTVSCGACWPRPGAGPASWWCATCRAARCPSRCWRWPTPRTTASTASPSWPVTSPTSSRPTRA